MKYLKDNWFIILFLVIATIVTIKSCEKEPVIKTEVKYVTKTDTITETIIKEKPVLKYVERLKNIKGKDSIVYVDKPTETSIEANQYDAVVKTDSSRADLKILTTGELLDVTGTITYKQKQTTITKYKESSSAFLYLEVPFDKRPERFELGIDYQIKNRLLIGVSGDYNTITKSINANFKLGFKLF